jgi:hypothetical protein
LRGGEVRRRIALCVGARFERFLERLDRDVRGERRLDLRVERLDLRARRSRVDLICRGKGLGDLQRLLR